MSRYGRRRRALVHAVVLVQVEEAVAQRAVHRGRVVADRVLALAFVFERRPAVKHVDELKIAFVDVPLLNLVRVLAAVGADHMGDVVAVGGVFGAQVAVIEDVAQSRFPRCVGGDMMDEIPPRPCISLQ